MKPTLIGQRNDIDFRNNHARSFILYFAPDRRLLGGSKYMVIIDRQLRAL